MNKLDLLRTIKSAGIVRQRGQHADFEEVLALIDRLELEGLIEDVYRHRESQSAAHAVDLVKVMKVTNHGGALIKAMI